MIKIANNRFLDAFLKFLLFSAILHFLVLVVTSIITLDIGFLNYFDIIDVNLFLPGIDVGMISQIFSASLIIILYALIFFLYTKKNKS